MNFDIAVIAGTVTVAAPGVDGTDPNGLTGEGRVVTRRKQVGYKLLDIPLDNAHNFRAAAHNLANRCEPNELQYLQRVAMIVVEQTRDDTRITHATQAKRANRLRSRIDRLTQRRFALSTATRGGAASTWRLVNRRDGTVIFEGDPARVELYAAELERRYKRWPAEYTGARFPIADSTVSTSRTTVW